MPFCEQNVQAGNLCFSRKFGRFGQPGGVAGGLTVLQIFDGKCTNFQVGHI